MVLDDSSNKVSVEETRPTTAKRERSEEGKREERLVARRTCSPTNEKSRPSTKPDRSKEEKGEKGRVAQRVSGPFEEEEPSIFKLVSVYLKQDDNVATVNAALEKIMKLCYCVKTPICKCVYNHAATIQLSGHLVIVWVMKKFPDAPSIQAAGCGALMNIASRDDMVVSEQIVTYGGFETVLTAMHKFIHFEQVQLAGCGALLNLTRFEDHMYHFVKLGGLSVIIAAMKAFPLSNMLQDYACSTLANMAAWNDVKDSIEDAGGIEVLAAAMKNFAKGSKVYVAAKTGMQCVVDW